MRHAASGAAPRRPRTGGQLGHRLQRAGQVPAGIAQSAAPQVDEPHLQVGRVLDADAILGQVAVGPVVGGPPVGDPLDRPLQPAIAAERCAARTRGRCRRVPDASSGVADRGRAPTAGAPPAARSPAGILVRCRVGDRGAPALADLGQLGHRAADRAQPLAAHGRGPDDVTAAAHLGHQTGLGQQPQAVAARGPPRPTHREHPAGGRTRWADRAAAGPTHAARRPARPPPGR